MQPLGFGTMLAGVAFLAACDVAYNSYSANCSAPQTTELFAEDRNDTLMHWVYIADATALGLGLAGSIIGGTPWPIIGAALVVGLMHFNYVHAVKRGLGVPPPANAKD